MTPTEIFMATPVDACYEIDGDILTEAELLESETEER